MGKIDIVMKRFVGISDIFAQLFNVGLFQGSIVVKEDELTDENPLEDIRIQKGKGSESLFERTRDVKKRSNLGYSLAILGVENQQVIHNYMPARIMLYDAVAYDMQLKETAEEYERKGIAISYGEGVPRGTKVLPVITMVFYTGKEKWEEPKELFDLLTIPEEKKELMQRYINNYKIHVIDACHLTDEEINQYDGDLKAFFIMMREEYSEEMLSDVVARHRETWYTVSTVKKDKRYREYIDTVDDEELAGGVNMCKTLDFIENRGLERGRQEGMERGRQEEKEHGIQILIQSCKELGVSKEATKEKLMNKFSLDEGTAQEYMNRFWKSF